MGGSRRRFKKKRWSGQKKIIAGRILGKLREEKIRWKGKILREFGVVQKGGRWSAGQTGLSSLKEAFLV